MNPSTKEILNEGIKAQQEGNFKKAKYFYNVILEQTPDHSDANHNLGVLETSLNNHLLAKKFFEHALKSNPKIKQFWISYIANLINLEDIRNAETILDKGKSLGLSQNEIDFFYYEIKKIGGKDKLNELIKLFRNSEYGKVEKLALSMLNENPNDVNCLKILGTCYHKLNRLDHALSIYDRLIILDTQNIEVLNNIGLIYQVKEDFEKAKNTYKKSSEINPHHSQSYLNLLYILKKMKKIDEMILECKKFIRLNPHDANLLNNFANGLQELHKYQEAEAIYKKALNLDPNLSDIYVNYGNLLQQLERNDEAQEKFTKAIKINPHHILAYNNLGNVYRKLCQPEKAQEAFETVIKLDPKFAAAYCNLGHLFYSNNQYEIAIQNYNKALNINDKFENLTGALLFSQAKLCDWTDRAINIKKMMIQIKRGEQASVPFNLFPLIDEPEIKKQVAKLYSKKFKKNFIFKRTKVFDENKKIKIGYFSPDFKAHPIGYSVCELFELYNRDKFEIQAFYYGEKTQDETYLRIKKGVDQFHEVKNLSDKEIVSLSNKHEIDIAIDLCCYTGPHRTNIFAMSAAPIQMTHLYAGSMGSDYFDYIIADKTLIPETHKKYYCEDVLYLPSWQANESIKEVSKKNVSKKDFGIPEEKFIFCCFNNFYKLSPEMFDLWSEILDKVDESILILPSGLDAAKQNLKKEIKLRGIDPNRLVFLDYVQTPQHLARLKLMDLSLDTFPFTGGVTTSDAVRMGLPVVTCLGNSFGSRVSGSVLKALNMDELIAKSKKEYVNIAIELANNKNKLKKIKNKLKQNLPGSLLFDTKSYCYHLEEAFLKVLKKNK
ncbi:MAG: hypothetical protein CMN44_05705 [SAR116 cluster bacterium]|nr:hypothetical protein [SAR116 cluster bacterium]RPH09958.1 MAG: tetratricopeptide repeat protein [Alphaproteobacteria bacterium TMED54]